MSASGVDKTKLDVPGRDILLVSDYDVANGRMVLSVPPGVEPRRVSVDAIEHWMIYQEHPGVGAIVHVHAWVDGIEAMDVNYPCGTEELAAPSPTSFATRTIPTTPSSACGTTASPSPARASTRSSTASSRAFWPRSR